MRLSEINNKMYPSPFTPKEPEYVQILMVGSLLIC